ncbi:hypothetical protein ACETK8_18530 [Brevundimonas staleyi]|uniref:Uncharacterized protein n=1 Tax=Brevundimonas staleyi TaxID=74326 RepID=A0ABW0FSH6_9CAUL
MDMVERYLEAVAAQLSADEREDIVAELRDLILSRIEAKEEALGRALTDDEKEAILKEIGHPLVVAARYRKGPDSLIGPELFPYWLYGVKAGLVILLVVHGISLLMSLVGGPRDVGQAIAQAFHSYFGAGLTLIGALTLAGALMEHYDIKPKWLTEWRVKDLSAFQLTDPSQWSAAANAAGKTTGFKAPQVRRGSNPMVEAGFSFLALAIFCLWWIGLVHFPGLGDFRIDGARVAMTPAPIWATLFTPILAYALAQMAVDLFVLLRPEARRMKAILAMLIGCVGLWLTYMVFQAGHWFTLSVGADQARVAGDWVMLDLDRLRGLGEGERDLVGVASTLSLIGTWFLTICGLSMAFTVVANAWRAVQPGVASVTR